MGSIFQEDKNPGDNKSVIGLHQSILSTGTSSVKLYCMQYGLEAKASKGILKLALGSQFTEKSFVRWANWRGCLSRPSILSFPRRSFFRISLPVLSK